ncbi:putative beta-N-acetylglucosaminidase [Desulfosarcina variabilis str. Montpellier]
MLKRGPDPLFRLTGWETVGDHIQWVDQNSASNASDAHQSGRRCINITRDKANEIDEAEGVISNYIPVIPGNYDFTYRVRLQNIVSNKRRLGVRLYDAIVVNVLFFDKDKQPLNPAGVNPLSGGLLDNSDKSFSFSNFWRIEDFPWGKVRGRSYNYPFSEGDIPDQTRYVRLFFGLKGTGSVWLDDIYFGYSKWNFTALERFTPFFNRHFTLAETLIPTPKHVREVDAITYYHSHDPIAHLPVIVLPENPTPADRSAAILVQTKLGDVLAEAIPGKIDNQIKIKILEKDYGEEDLSASHLIISIGKNRVFQTVQPELPMQSVRGNAQGYVLKAERFGGGHVLFLMGVTSIGNYYAATTAVQLFEKDQFVYHNATVADYPDFLGRSYVFNDWRREDQLQRDLGAVNRMSFYKLNKVYVGYDRAKKNWYQPEDLFRRGLAEAGRQFKENGVMHLAVMVNPYSHFPMETAQEDLSDALRYTWTHSSPESLETLKDVYRIGLDAGADTIMLLSDDFVPHVGANRQNYALFTAEDRRRFVNLQNAQAHVINQLKTWLDAEYPGTRFEFCPPWYSNEHIDRSDGKAELYLEELAFQIPRDVAIIWTGPTIRSLSIDMVDLHRFNSLIGRWPMLWDNTLYARNIERKRYGGYATYYPGKVTLCNLFEPYDTNMPGDFQQYSDSRQKYTNGHASTEIYKIKYATVADYEWNIAAYHPERSLWNVLSRTYGPAGAEQLIRFSDAYYHVYGICMRMESQGDAGAYLAIGKKSMARLDDSFLNLSQTLSKDEALLNELGQFRDRQKKRLDRLTQGVNPEGS